MEEINSSATSALTNQLEAAKRTITVLMDRIEKMTASAVAPSGLNLNSLAMQQLVRQRTIDLQRMNEGLIQAATEHRQTGRILREMQRIANVGGWELCVESGKVLVSDQVMAMLGSPAGHGPDVDFLCSCFADQHAIRFREHLAAAITSGTPFDLELEAVANQDGHRIFRVVGQPLKEGKSIATVYGVIKDITRVKNAEFLLSQSQRLESIGQLASGVAHEINTPVQYVGDNVRFIQMHFPKLMSVVARFAEQMDPNAPRIPWEQRRAEIDLMMAELDFDFLKEEIPLAISQSLEGLQRVTTIVRAMKEFSHPGSSSKEPADLNRSILSTIEVCRNRLKDVAELRTDFDEALPLVPCFIAELNQVLLNLIVNAADAISESAAGRAGKGSICITTRCDGATVEIRVSDNGPGMPESVQKHLFEPFFTTKPVGKGTGQGLSLSRNVVTKRHGGELTFQSAAGAGTTFIVRLPLAEQKPIQVSEAA